MLVQGLFNELKITWLRKIKTKEAKGEAIEVEWIVKVKMAVDLKVIVIVIKTYDNIIMESRIYV